MDNKIVHILIFIIYLFIIIISFFVYLFLYLKNSNYSYYLSNRYNSLLICITLGVLINSFDLLLIGLVTKNNYGLLKFNLVYIFNLPSVIIFSYRGIKCYIDNYISFKKIENIKSFNKHIILCFIIYISYILFINLIFNKNITIISWHFYPFYIFILIFIFVFNPIIIFLLNKIGNNLKYDFIYSLLFVLFSFGVFTINYFKHDIIFLNYISSYWSLISSIFVHFSYTFLHFIHVRIEKIKVIEENIKDYDLNDINNTDINIIKIISEYKNIENEENEEQKNIKMTNLLNRIYNNKEIMKNINLNSELNIHNMNMFISKLENKTYINLYKNILNN